MERIHDSGFTHPDRKRGRGARSNASGRFETTARVAFDDGWSSLDEDPPPLRTEVQVDASRSIITSNNSPDIPFDQSINPYRGCEHGCIYCYARPTHAWLGLSPGLDFESRLFFKPNAAALLEAELSNPRYQPKLIAIGTNTDPYQPIEREREIMRGILAVLDKFRHPVGITTKSCLVMRDIDILKRMAARHQAKVFLSVTTLDRHLARKMEPRASTPGRRIDAIKALADAGIPVGMMVAPIVPGLTDHEIESILEAGRAAGATEAGYVMLRLPLEIKALFEEWLQEAAPLRAKRVLDLVRGVREGQLNNMEWGKRMSGTGPYAALIAKRFEIAKKRLGFGDRTSGLDVSHFRRPPKAGDQLSLF